MKILFVAWRDLANDLAGGSEVLIDRLATGLAGRGHEVGLLCARPVGGPRAYRVVPNGGTIDQYLRAPRSYRRHFPDADLVVDVANGLSFYAPLWRRGPSVCFVNHIHTDQWGQWFPAPVAAVGRGLERHAMPAAYRNRLFVAVSPSTADSLQAIGVDRERIRIIINGTDVPDEVGAESFDPLFVGLGRLVPHKRFELAVQAWEHVRPHVGGRLVIAGQGPEHGRLLATAGAGVELPGRIDEPAKADLLARAWLLVHPASHEGWGLVVTEAAAHGTPSLAFRVPGLRDSVVDGTSGILVDRPEDLAPTWLRIAQDPVLRARLRDGARRRALACTWDRTVERFEEVCVEAVETHRRAVHVPHGRWSGASEREEPAPERPELTGLPIGTGGPRLARVTEPTDLTVVVPAYDEAARLPRSLPVLLDHLATRSTPAEVIVVDDGSADDTVRIADALLADAPRASVLRLGRHAGKGAAVRAGVAAATGQRIVFMDADLATDLSGLDPLLDALEDVHVALGSRGAPGAVTSGLTPSSDAAHRAFNGLARRATGLSVADFQCGFKAFRAPAAKLLFHYLREPGWSFDVELVATADRLGLHVREVPVRWAAVRGSHVRIVVDSALMAAQILRLGRRAPGGRMLAVLEVFARDPDLEPDAVATAVRAGLPVAAPVLPADRCALVLLPFATSADAAEIATDLEKHLDVLARPTALDGSALFGPHAHRIRAALAAS